MSLVSSNTLFHFTDSASNLINIIKEGFKPKFCLEEHGSGFLFSKDNEEAIPMTCFCDLPLSNIKTHLEFYGSYGLGLSKDWGKSKGLTPVTYVHENSTQIKYLKHLVSLILKLVDSKKAIPVEKDPYVALFELSSFIKSYEGQMWRIDKYITKKFYDEREWRYVPYLATDREVIYRLFKDEFLNEIKRADANEMLAQTFKLLFEYMDIKYLIVKKENEMVSLSDALDSMRSVYSESAIKILKTKIISCEQITEDF